MAWLIDGAIHIICPENLAEPLSLLVWASLYIYFLNAGQLWPWLCLFAYAILAFRVIDYLGHALFRSSNPDPMAALLVFVIAPAGLYLGFYSVAKTVLPQQEAVPRDAAEP